uniref:EGF-like domain-containing protein n=1 Tax=Anisakis simplex TaxID=6269 RepID=A0A0M3JJA0_ANISI
LCGSVRCVDMEHVRDGKMDCEDGSDEKNLASLISSQNLICPDGSAARTLRLKKNLTTADQTVYTTITECKNASLCREALGEMCIVVGGAQHCVCKKGTVRPHGTPRCVPEPLLQQYLNNIIGNCTAIRRELVEMYGPQVSFHTESIHTSYSTQSITHTI